MISSSSMTRMAAVRVIALCPSARERAGLRSGVGSAGAGRALGRREGERQAEPRAVAGRALAGDGAVVFLHDPVCDREPEAGALPDLLGREEWIIDPGELFRRDS